MYGVIGPQNLHKVQQLSPHLTRKLCRLGSGVVGRRPSEQVRLDHEVVDLAQVMWVPPLPPPADRLPAEEFTHLHTLLASSGRELLSVRDSEQRLEVLRRMYEPYTNGLAERLLMTLPPWSVARRPADNWRTSAWEQISQEVGAVRRRREDDHF